ncbi:hypothetical protein [uncultured Parolsenella sp.]|uniref:hypothetical protein n=1 Tax=uncultured Parolsenella sp. TaxID=2083008 RepID=UPI0025F456F0|nr:hypothetical protein [uncultured Parolsenella sp.]
MDGRGACPEKGVAMGAEPGTKCEKLPKDCRDEAADYAISTGGPSGRPPASSASPGARSATG